MKAEFDFAAVEASAAERRGEHRTTAVYRPVLIETEEFAGFCLARNLSPSGMMGMAYAQFAVDQPIKVHFHPDCVATGTIIWSLDERIGVSFDQKIDVDELLQYLAGKSMGSRVNRAPRVHIECSGELVIDGRALPVTVLDISQQGIKAAASFVRPDDEVVVQLAGLEPHKAEVRWTQAGMAGLKFIRPIGFEELAKWIIQR